MLKNFEAHGRLPDKNGTGLDTGNDGTQICVNDLCSTVSTVTMKKFSSVIMTHAPHLPWSVPFNPNLVFSLVLLQP